MVEESDELVESSDAAAVAADAVVCVEVVVPMEPSKAMTPNASAKIASDAATTRLRMREMRLARARSLSLASSFGERPGSGDGGRGGWGGGGVAVRSDMAAKVGARCESGPGRPRELPGAVTLVETRAGRGRPPGGAPTLDLAGLRARPCRPRSPHETEGPQAHRDGRRVHRAARRGAVSSHQPRRRRLIRGADVHRPRPAPRTV